MVYFENFLLEGKEWLATINDGIVIVFGRSQEMTYFKHDIDTETPNVATIWYAFYIAIINNFDLVRCSRFKVWHSKTSLSVFVQIFTRFHCHPLLHKKKINFSIKGNLRHSLNGLIIL